MNFIFQKIASVEIEIVVIWNLKLQNYSYYILLEIKLPFSPQHFFAFETPPATILV